LSSQHAALDLGRDLDNPSVESEIRNDLGDTCRLAGDDRAAAEQYQIALALASGCADRYQQGRAAFGIARMRRAAGDDDAARAQAAQAWAVLADLGVPEAADVRAFLRD
jgi:hypothetical protein